MLNIKNTLDGYLKGVEIIGNTVQESTRLANIRSVGDKLGNQQLYKISLQTDNGNGVIEVIEILSPVQLEKIGVIADRIICKDGVWVVEKNIETYKFDQGYRAYGYILNNSWLQTENTIAFYTYYFRDNADVKILAKNGSAMCDMLPYTYQNITQTDSPAVYGSNQYVAFRIPTSELKTPDIFGVRDWMDEKQPTIKYMRETPQFIPLPNDQQVKLRTFAGQTNITFLTEIVGKVKAQVPKSLGAVVNTHTEQIEMLHNALKSVLAGDMYSLATILYPEDFEQNDNTEQDIMVIPE